MAASRKSPTMRRRLRKNRPSFGSGIIADGVLRSETMKPTAQGVFTLFWAWAYPCDRTWHVIATVFDIEKGTFSGVLGIRKRGSPETAPLGSFSIDSLEAGNAAVLSVQASHRFNRAGRYEVTLGFAKTKAELRIPFEVRTHAWPQFTRPQLTFAAQNPTVVGTHRANVACPKCKAAYTFEERVLGTAPLPAGVREFPTSGLLECEACGHEIPVRDIQGQLRQALKERLSAAMARQS